jgi:hypothetical protein
MELHALCNPNHNLVMQVAKSFHEVGDEVLHEIPSEMIETIYAPNMHLSSSYSHYTHIWHRQERVGLEIVPTPLFIALQATNYLCPTSSICILDGIPR